MWRESQKAHLGEIVGEIDCKDAQIIIPAIFMYKYLFPASFQNIQSNLMVLTGARLTIDNMNTHAIGNTHVSVRNGLLPVPGELERVGMKTAVPINLLQ